MRLVWSEVRDLIDMAGCGSLDELIAALEAYRAVESTFTESGKSTWRNRARARVELS